MKLKIKEIIVNILYLESINEVDETCSLFTELGLTSIDYIDLCYELNQIKTGVNIDNLWPINKMILDSCYYQNSQWTDKGWEKVCELIDLDKNLKQLPLAKLYDYFNVNYIEKRLGEIQ